MSPELRLWPALVRVGSVLTLLTPFPFTPAVIIPELVLPNREVASVRVSPSVRARDDDSGNNGVILFSILQVDFISKDGATIPFQGFWISTSSEADVFTGSIQ
ncbi:Cadherin- member 2 [Saguinus oedipus]|uniref:Cadherin- member 2 n=1 Tax=Saguinus oedipus TaxID=9490 RepID=A0ABQ9WA35_SAGOE|nr:Cadherin- member 2 [Saguinus oedipus]